MCLEYLPRPISRSTLGRSVVVIIGLGSKKQMGGIAARRVIAVVADEQPVRDGAVVDFPRNAMGEKWSSVVSTRCNLAVAVGGETSRPTPAFPFISALDFLPKAIDQWASFHRGNIHRTDAESKAETC
jgi:hypothetical protein